jgi:16S rRNA processing protein RimM
MTKDECYELGRIIKPHGLKGEVQILLDVDYPEDYEDMESVFVEQKGELVPYFIESIKIRTNLVIVKFEGIENSEAAKKLKNAVLYLPEDQLEDLEEDEYYMHELVGCLVIDEIVGELGTVKTVHSLPAQNLLALDYQNKEVLIPIIEHFVLKVDKEAKKIMVKLPDGLLDVYLADEHKQDE